MNEQELMQKLALSKAIMDKHTDMPRNISSGSLPTVESFDIPNSKYNIPQEFLQESFTPTQNMPMSNPTKAVGTPTIDAIKNSRLPDEIKKLMIEHPISQPNTMTNPTLSNELVERATRLMGTQKSVQESKQTSKTKQTVNGGIDYSKIQIMIEEAINNALKENGLLVESTEKSNEQFSFRVGKHIFEGKMTKIKKVS